MEPEEFLKMFKPAAYIPAKDTKDGKKLYLMYYDNEKYGADQIANAVPAVRRYVDNCIFLPKDFTIATKPEIKKFLDQFIKEKSGITK